MPHEPSLINRRRVLQSAGAAISAAAAHKASAVDDTDDAAAQEYRIKNDRVHQSIVAWCFKPMPVAELASHAVRMGYKSVELVPVKEWPMLKSLGLTCAIGSSHGF